MEYRTSLNEFENRDQFSKYLDSFIGEAPIAEDVDQALESDAVVRAIELDRVLGTFASLSTEERESVLPQLMKFVLMQKGTGIDKKCMVDSDVLTQLADPEESRLLRQAAHLLTSRTYLDEADEPVENFLVGTYDFTELDADGSVKAHAVHRVGGGLAQDVSKDFAPLARYSLLKALLAFHCRAAAEEGYLHIAGRDMISVMDLAKQKAYFKRIELGHMYVGNYGLMGASGVEMTRGVIDWLSGGVLNHDDIYSEFFMAGGTDSFAAKVVTSIRDSLKAGEKPDDFFFLDGLDISGKH